MKKPHVNLMMHEHDDFLGVIVLMPSGAVFTNQTGGTACMHPDAEGVFVPLLYGRGTEPQELVDQWHNHLESYDPDKVSVWLKELALDELLEPISIWDIRGTTLEGQDGWGEAWLPVRIKEAPENTDNWELLHDFVGHYAILTYSNSD